MPENALSVDVTPGRLSTPSCNACQPSQPSTARHAEPAGKAPLIPKDKVSWYGNRDYGFRPGGNGGSSRISVMVTRRLADNVGSSGNSGWLSALPETAKMWEDGTPSHSRIWRTALARSAERSKAPYSLRDGTKPAAVWPAMEIRSG